MSKNIDDGGPAFETLREGIYTGMTRRQWLAGVAMQGLLACGYLDKCSKNRHDGDGKGDLISISYGVADTAIKNEKNEQVDQ